jgi:hypothetical protein
VTVICLATVPTVDPVMNEGLPAQLTVDPVMNEGLPAQLTNNRYK